MGKKRGIVKKCNTCGTLKVLALFPNNRCTCKVCWNAYQRDYTRKHPKELKVARRARYVKNQEKMIKASKEYRDRKKKKEQKSGI